VAIITADIKLKEAIFVCKQRPYNISAITFEVRHRPNNAIGRNQCLHRRIASSNDIMNKQTAKLITWRTVDRVYAANSTRKLFKISVNKELITQPNAVSQAVGCGEFDFPRQLTFFVSNANSDKDAPWLTIACLRHHWRIRKAEYINRAKITKISYL